MAYYGKAGEARGKHGLKKLSDVMQKKYKIKFQGA